METLETMVGNNSLAAWILAGGAATSAFLALVVFRRRVTLMLTDLARRTSGDFDDFLVDLIKTRTRTLALGVVAVFVGTWFLSLPERVLWLARNLAILAASWQVGLWGSGLITYLVIRKTKPREGSDPAGQAAYHVISYFSRVALWAVIGLLVLRNLGVDVTGILAGLGVGGIAVALAAQNILGDLFASICIALDKPFAVGDTIEVGGYLGMVEQIGLKTSRIRSISGEQIIMANADLLKSPVRNYKRMQERRVVFTVGATYETPPEKLARIPILIRDVIAGTPEVRFDRAHFFGFGGSSLDFEVVYFVTNSDYLAYMNARQAINFGIFRKFAEEKIAFAYPTQTVHLAAAGKIP